MRKEPELSTLSTEDLNKRAKTTKFATGLLLGVILMQFVIGTYLTLKQGFNVFIVIPFAFLPLVLVNYGNLKKINEEIAKRNA